MIIATVNVNGIRAAARKGFGAWRDEVVPDVLLLQEVRAPKDIATELIGSDYQTFVHPSVLAGRAGVAVAIKQGITVGEVRWGLAAGLPASANEAANANEAASADEPDVDSGRWLEVDIPDVLGGGVTVISAYLHSGVADKPEKMAAKYAHLERVTQRLSELADPQRRPLAHVLMAGDFNIVRGELDIKNWKANHNKTSGVLDAEIAYLTHWFGTADSASAAVAGDLAGATSTAGTANATGATAAAGVKGVERPESGSLGFADVQRQLAGSSEKGPYTWWSNRGQAFANDVGWRIDYQLADQELAARARSQRVDRAPNREARFSDHAPVVIEYQD